MIADRNGRAGMWYPGRRGIAPVALLVPRVSGSGLATVHRHSRAWRKPDNRSAQLDNGVRIKPAGSNGTESSAGRSAGAVDQSATTTHVSEINARDRIHGVDERNVVKQQASIGAIRVRLAGQIAVVQNHP